MGAAGVSCAASVTGSGFAGLSAGPRLPALQLEHPMPLTSRTAAKAHGMERVR